MKKIIFILNIFHISFSIAQNPDKKIIEQKDYYSLMSYTPKSFKPNDSLYIKKTQILKEELNTINNLRLYYSIRKELKLSKNEEKWLEDLIDRFTKSLYKDGGKILISTVGGYSGCPDNMIDIIKLNNIKITNLKFCYTCTDYNRDKDFIELFNNRMYSLMKIKPPNIKTHRFHGKFIGSDKYNRGIELTLNKDRTFKFYKRKEHESYFTEGLWENNNDTLVLKLKTVTKNNNLTFDLTNTECVKFHDLKFQLKKEKLFSLYNRKSKLKKNN